jgi:hypothetical protein
MPLRWRTRQESLPAQTNRSLTVAALKEVVRERSLHGDF